MCLMYPNYVLTKMAFLDSYFFVGLGTVLGSG